MANQGSNTPARQTKYKGRWAHVHMHQLCTQSAVVGFNSSKLDGFAQIAMPEGAFIQEVESKAGGTAAVGQPYTPAQRYTCARRKPDAIMLLSKAGKCSLGMCNSAFNLWKGTIALLSKAHVRSLKCTGPFPTS